MCVCVCACVCVRVCVCACVCERDRTREGRGYTLVWPSALKNWSALLLSERPALPWLVGSLELCFSMSFVSQLIFSSFFHSLCILWFFFLFSFRLIFLISFLLSKIQCLFS